MRSALTKLSEIKELKTAPGKPGTASFKTPTAFDFRQALDAAVVAGCSELKDYKVLD